MKKLLNKEELQTILGMNIYWEEVFKRTDMSPLSNELREVIGMLGTKILFIVAEYAKLQLKQEKDGRNKQN